MTDLKKKTEINKLTNIPLSNSGYYKKDNTSEK